MEFGGHLFDIPVINTDPNEIDFDESHTKGPNIVIVPRLCFHYSTDSQNSQTCSTSDHFAVHPSNLKSHGESKDVETATDLRHNDGFKQTSEYGH